MKLLVFLISLYLLAISFIGPIHAQNMPPVSPESTTAATVNSFKISIPAARRAIAKTIPNRPDAEQNTVLLNAAVNRLVDRRVIYEHLLRENRETGAAEIRIKLEQFKSDLAQFEKTLESHLTESQQTLAELEFEIAWKIAWNRTLKTELTDNVLESYFGDHRHQFDGSRMRVAHLLIKRDADGTLVKASALANQIYQDLTTDKIDWAAATQTHSEAPTRNTGGEIGWIEIDKPMPASFSAAAFQLAPEEISHPIETKFGLHLIKCLELESGKIGWRDARFAVQKQATKDLFQRLADQHRHEVTIEYLPGFSPLKFQSDNESN